MRFLITKWEFLLQNERKKLLKKKWQNGWQHKIKINQADFSKSLAVKISTPLPDNWYFKVGEWWTCGALVKWWYYSCDRLLRLWENMFCPRVCAVPQMQILTPSGSDYIMCVLCAAETSDIRVRAHTLYYCAYSYTHMPTLTHCTAGMRAIHYNLYAKADITM